MDNRDVLKKIYQGGLQEHFELDEVKIFLNNLRNDCANYCIKDLTRKTLTDEEKLCSRNYFAKNFYLLNSNPKLQMEHIKERAHLV